MTVTQLMHCSLPCLLSIKTLAQCPRLKTVDPIDVCFRPDSFEHFVKRRVKSDLDEPAPDLVTSLALVGHSPIGEELRATICSNTQFINHLHHEE